MASHKVAFLVCLLVVSGLCNDKNKQGGDKDKKKTGGTQTRGNFGFVGGRPGGVGGGFHQGGFGGVYGDGLHGGFAGIHAGIGSGGGSGGGFGGRPVGIGGVYGGVHSINIPHAAGIHGQTVIDGSYPGQVGVGGGLVQPTGFPRSTGVGDFVQPSGFQGATSSGLVHGNRCSNWCKTHEGEVYCCGYFSIPAKPPVTNPGQCPPQRTFCLTPMYKKHVCSNHDDCFNDELCCFNKCQEEHTCKNPI